MSTNDGSTQQQMPANERSANQPTSPSPRTGAASAPVSHERAFHRGTSPRLIHGRSLSYGLAATLSPTIAMQPANTQTNNAPPPPLLLPGASSSSLNTNTNDNTSSPLLRPRRLRTASLGRALSLGSVGGIGQRGGVSPAVAASLSPRFTHRSLVGKKIVSEATADAQTQSALKVNDSMVYLDGPQVYACQQCRTHLTSHDDIISKSFHGRHGRAYLLDQAVNVRVGPAEDRMLMTGLHAVCDIFCKRCETLIGWTYQKAYEASQKYKEGKFIIEKINLYLEESDYYTIAPPAGERRDRWRQRSISWGNQQQDGNSDVCAAEIVYEYPPPSATSGTRGTGADGTTVLGKSL